VLLACVFLGLAAWGNSIRRTLEKGLVADTGMSARKVHAIVLTTALLLWVPVTLLRGWVLLVPVLL
jgi:phosphate/sulfate permease